MLVLQATNTKYLKLLLIMVAKNSCLGLNESNELDTIIVQGQNHTS